MLLTVILWLQKNYKWLYLSWKTTVFLTDCQDILPLIQHSLSSHCEPSAEIQRLLKQFPWCPAAYYLFRKAVIQQMVTITLPLKNPWRLLRGGDIQTGSWRMNRSLLGQKGKKRKNGRKSGGREKQKIKMARQKAQRVYKGANVVS